MRRVTERPSGPGFDNWLIKAIKARNELVEAWKTECETAGQQRRSIAWSAKINEKLYKDLRQVFLYSAFHKKCAYCEVNHSDGYPLQVEHYRPKKGVTVDRQPIDHPGYFWLAYEWWNLVLSCAHCNTRHTDPSGGSHDGKLNEFPVNGTRISEPGDDPEQWETELISEEPLLLHPYFDDPEEHIDFDPFGVPLSKSPRGKATIEICDLGRSSLVEKRLNLKGDILLGMMHHLLNGDAMDSVNPPSSELFLWRKCIIQHRLVELCSATGMVASRV